MDGVFSILSRTYNKTNKSVQSLLPQHQEGDHNTIFDVVNMINDNKKSQ